MASEVDIANVALGHLGDSATVASLDPPEGSAQSEHCARFYPMARDTLLSVHTWSFATRRKTLAQMVDTAPGWSFAYALPSDALDIFAILAPGDVDPACGALGAPAHSYVREINEQGSQVIYCNVENAVAKYSMRVEDTTRFSPLFVTTLTWQLASMLAGPVIKGDMGMAEAKRCAQMAQAYLAQAQMADAKQRHTPTQHTPDWTAVRGTTFDRGR